MDGLRTRIDTAVRQEALRDILTSQLRFHFPQITAVEFGEAEVVVVSGEPVPRPKLERTIGRILDRFQAIPAGVRPKTLLDVRDVDSVAGWLARPARFPTAALAAAAAELVEELHRIAPRPGRQAVPGRSFAHRAGVNVYGRETAALLTALDRFTSRCLVHAYDAEELLIPSLIPSWIVDRAGYFETGCQHLSYVAPVSNDPDLFDGFLPFWRTAATGEQVDRRLLDYLKTPRDLLNPAACLHCYPLLADQLFAQHEALVLTVGGSVFRDEAGNLNNQERLYEFRMREGVVIGGQEPVTRLHAELLDLLALAGLLFGLDFSLRTASDMFFTDGAGQQLFAQLVSDNKIELVARSSSLGSVATASLNKHGSHFSEAFRIRDERGLPAATICIGFGLDRLALLATERHGSDPAGLAEQITANAERLGAERR
jgi:hypothetical protein